MQNEMDDDPENRLAKTTFSPPTLCCSLPFKDDASVNFRSSFMLYCKS